MLLRYLKLIKPTEAIHVDKAAFMRLSPNIGEDMTIPEGVGKNESICQVCVCLHAVCARPLCLCARVFVCELVCV